MGPTIRNVSQWNRPILEVKENQFYDAEFFTPDLKKIEKRVWLRPVASGFKIVRIQESLLKHIDNINQDLDRKPIFVKYIPDRSPQFVDLRILSSERRPVFSAPARPSANPGRSSWNI